MKKLLAVLSICLCIGGLSACDLSGLTGKTSDSSIGSEALDGLSDWLESNSIEVPEDHEHSWDLTVVTKPATCEEAGENQLFCQCGTTMTEEIPALGHAYGDGEITKKPTCEEKGEMTYTCANGCGGYTEEIPALGHAYNDGEITKQPTCEEKGEKTYTCANGCGGYTEEIPALGHAYNDGEVTKQPTCEEKGIKTYTCANGCGGYTEDIPAFGHTYDQIDKDDEKHWDACWCGVTQNEENHYGGEATETEQAVCEYCGHSYGELKEPASVDPTPDVTTYERMADGTINFGSYPQTKVTDSALTTALTTKAGTLPTSSNSQGWTAYPYYINGSNTASYMWYQDVAYEEERYRGVYFTSYRPSHLEYSSSKDYTYQDENGYTRSNVYWFQWETLNWTILEESDGEVFLLCNSIIDSQEYYHNMSSRTINGKTVYTNNYAESNIRKWLNETFYETAFTEIQQNLIKTTNVDNSARSTNPYNNATQWNSGVNQYACENTEDKIFLLSEEEVTNPNYGFNGSASAYDTARWRKTTDYAQAQGCYTYTGSTYAGNGYWWLRSPYYSDYYIAWHVRYNGDANSNFIVNRTYYGVVPALRMVL